MVLGNIRERILHSKEKEMAKQEKIEEAKEMAKIKADPEVIEAQRQARIEAAKEAVKQRAREQVRESYFPTPQAPKPGIGQRFGGAAAGIGSGFSRLATYDVRAKQRQGVRTSARNRNVISVRGQTYVIRGKKAIKLPQNNQQPQQQGANPNVFGDLFEVKPYPIGSQQYGNYSGLFDSKKIFKKKRVF